MYAQRGAKGLTWPTIGNIIRRGASNPISIHISISQPSGSQFETVQGTRSGERADGGDKRKRIHREQPKGAAGVGGSGSGGGRTGERGELISMATYYHLSPYRCNGRAAPIINP